MNLFLKIPVMDATDFIQGNELPIGTSYRLISKNGEGVCRGRSKGRPITERIYLPNSFRSWKQMSTAARIALRNEIELTREKFHRFLVMIPDEALRLPSKDPAWTNGELLYLMSTSPRIIKSFLKRYTSENIRFNYVSRVTGPLLQKTNEIIIRSRGHKLTRWSIAEEYDSTSALVLELLDTVCDDDFEKTLTIPDIDPLLSGQVTIENIFHYVKNHFYAYRNQINVVKQLSEN